MWYAVTIDKTLDCNKICNIIQKNLFDKLIKQNVSLEGKTLYLSIKDSEIREPQILCLEYKKENIYNE